MTDFRKLAEKLADQLWDANSTLAQFNESGYDVSEDCIMQTWELLADAHNLIQEPEPTMTEPDYKIEECFDESTKEVYFQVIGMNGGFLGPRLFPPRFTCLENAKDYVRMLRKYSQRIFHYVED